MNYDDIHVFLTVIDEGTISKAAAKLYTSQSNVSAKIMNLETTIGVPLLLRKKGLRHIELTSQGERFLELAKQMETLHKEIDTLRYQPERTYLSIGAVDTINTYTFVRLYQTFIEAHPDICLSLHTYHSSELHNKLEAHTVDLGFTNAIKKNPHIKATLLFEEEMVLITHCDSPFYHGILPEELPAHLEIFQRWNLAYETWHDQYWPGKQYLARISTASMTPHYLTVPGRWAITGIETAKCLINEYPLVYYHIKDAPPKRQCYMIEHQYPKPSCAEGIVLFKEAVARYIDS